MSKYRYYIEVNILRGIAVIFVVLGHSFPRVSTNLNAGGAELILTGTLYSFHMALFIFMSGFVNSRKMYNVSGAEEIKKNAIRMLTPYFVLSIISSVLKLYFEEYASNSFSVDMVWTILFGSSPNGGLWYLWALFFISLIFWLISHVKRNDAVFIVVGLALYAVYIFFPPPYGQNVFRYGIFYAIGMVVSRHYDALLMWHDRAIGTKKLAKLIPAAGFASILIFNIFLPGVARYSYVYPITSLVAIYSAFLLSVNIIRSKSSFVARIQAGLNILGDFSADVYLLSYFVQVPIRVIGFTMLAFWYPGVVASMFVLGLLVPIFASKYLIRRFAWLSIPLVGYIPPKK